MNKDSRIFLIGMPGSGKSTIGSRFAERINKPFYDLDALIEEQKGMTVPEIFKQEGEAKFRELESKMLAEIIKTSQSGVISTGGGTPCYHDGMRLLLEHGSVVFLDVPLQILQNRTENTSGRPLLASQDDDRLSELYKERRPVYERAPYHINCGDDEVDSVVNKLLDYIN